MGKMSKYYKKSRYFLRLIIFLKFINKRYSFDIVKLKIT